MSCVLQDTLGGLQSQIDNLQGLLTSKVSETLAKHSTTECILVWQHNDFNKCSF